MSGRTASALERERACPLSACLPHVRDTSPRAQRGIAIHGFLADVVELGRDAALDRVDDEHRSACEVIDLERLGITAEMNFRPEARFIWDAWRDRAVEAGEDGFMGRDDFEVAVVVDLVAVSHDSLVVMEYKTGRDVTPAADNLQLKCEAVAAARAYGFDEVHAAIVYVHDDGSSWFDTVTLDAMDLDLAARELAEVVRAVEDAREDGYEGKFVKPRTGDHCRYCPALPNCPAQIRLARELAGDVGALEDELVAALTPDGAAAAWQRVKLIKRLVERVEAAVRTYAEAEPIDLGDGKVLGPKATRRESIDGGIAMPALLATYGEDVANAACKISATKSSVQKAMKAAQEDGAPLAPLVREALGVIREAGGIRTRTTTSVTEYRKPAELPA